jgi:MFS transporter, DHA1 family, inner membrane transport protein
LRIAALGLTSLYLGLAELGGEGLSAFLSDKFKPGVAVSISIGLNMVVALLMPVIGDTLTGAIIGLSLIFLSSEFFVVGILPVIIHFTAEGRITALSLKMTVHHGGVALGTAIGPFLFRQGWDRNFLLAAILDFSAILVLLFSIRQTHKA